MTKLAILEIGDGDFDRGFLVRLRIEDNGTSPTVMAGKLPPAPLLPQQYENWKSSYRESELGSYRKLEPIKGQTTHISISESASELYLSLNEWLNSSYWQFQPIRDKLVETFSQKKEETRFIIQTDEFQLWRLPWHLWDLLDGRYNVEPSLSRLTIEKKEFVPKFLKSKVKILVILGDSTDINVEADLELLKDRLPDAYIQPLIASRREQLSDELWEQSWDILFFAGHSSSESENYQGKLYINETESITIEDLKHGLENAIKQGLCLAIFNSCDGLGLARDLASLQMPAIIVMRERVPDEAAQKFLQYFLKAFAEDQKSLRSSVREARKRLLESLDNEYPCASWLPTLFDNPAEEPPTWIGLRKRNEEAKKRQKLWQVLAISLMITTLLMGLRTFGIFQTSELQTYDRFMQLRPSEPADSRLLIVAADRDDLENDEGYLLPDAKIAKLIEKLAQYQPAVIGLNIYRDRPQQPGNEALSAQLKNNKHLITICNFTVNTKGIEPPPASPLEQVGFDNLPKDSNSIYRRYLLFRTLNPTSTFDACNTHYSFSFQIAYRYLHKQGIQCNYNIRNDLYFRNTVFERLKRHSGAYQNFDDKGSQILINYRATSDIARKLTVRDILNSQFEPNWIQGKIVLIGGDDIFQNYEFNTPIGPLKGLFVQAHVISQMISAVLDTRPLIWWLPLWGEGILIWFWSFFGGIIVWYLQKSPLRLFLATALALTILSLLCLGFFLQGAWLPLVPSAFALMTTGTVVAVASKFQTRS
ncbi:CHASE2 domain-containing protein [Microcoleus sp. FACHB-68]|uniref:CHASE2 domain-containing protein n=1 Tax=Microcoleus sp. FACHB-68 TaxID=2692826 RepID=UPI00168920C2|nr:CHASE2 domain-containing protein [Microcoleus sp. FACHB-68]MBD1939053.1 CHASE2 domain-containing protein [Microcoleus sp. FACHB-68]